MVEEVDRQLKLHDFNTFSAFDFFCAGDFSSLLADKLGDNIKIAAENGYVLSFVNEISAFQMEETEYAMKCSKKHIIPIATTPHFFDNMSPRTKDIFAGLNWIDVSDKQETEAAEYIVQRLLEIDMKQYQSEE